MYFNRKTLSLHKILLLRKLLEENYQEGERRYNSGGKEVDWAAYDTVSCENSVKSLLLFLIKKSPAKDSFFLKI